MSAPAPPVPGLLRHCVLVLAGALGGLTIVALAGAATRPELWHAGLPQVGLAVAAAVGTGASAVVAVAALFGPFLATRRLVLGGEATAIEAAGWGRADLLRSVLPTTVCMVALAAFAGLSIEPAAWTAVHRVKGSPPVAAAAWARLQSGAVHTLPDGGAVVLQEGRLRFTTGDGRMHGELDGASPATTAWSFGAARIDSAEQGAWSADRLEVSLVRSEGWLDPPRSPWAAGWASLVGRRDEPRAARVLHRRLALVAAVVPLAILGLALGWSRRRWASVVVVLVPVGVFLVARAADTSGLPPPLAGWAPAVAASVVAVLFWGRRP